MPLAGRVWRRICPSGIRGMTCFIGMELRNTKNYATLLHLIRRKTRKDGSLRFHRTHFTFRSPLLSTLARRQSCGMTLSRTLREWYQSIRLGFPR
jgi:hypothetical protein